jgi:hypothetical protein
MGLGGPGRACSRQQAARGTWSAGGRRGGAGIWLGDGGGWIPSVQPCLGGSRWDGNQPSCSAASSPARLSPSVSPKATHCSVSHGVGVDDRAGWKPWVMRTMATPAGTVTSLEASSWRYSFFPASTNGGNPRAGLRFGQRRRACIVSSLGASPRWFVESFVRVLESMVAATQSAGFQGAMYTVVGAPWSTISLVGFGPAAHSPTLRRYWAGGALACAFSEFESVSWSSLLRLWRGLEARCVTFFPLLAEDGARWVLVVWSVWIVL